MKKYPHLSSLTRAGFMETIMYRAGLFSMFVGNLVFIIVIYHLWKAIFISAGVEQVKGMTFQETMISLSLITTLHTGMQIYIVQKMSVIIKTGEISLFLVKPASFPIYLFFYSSGDLLAQFLFVVIPSFLLVLMITWGTIHIGLHLIYFVVAIFVGLIMNYCIDFCVGMLCIYIESGWGINILKELIVSLFSGALIPIAFFPAVLKKMTQFLPFQAIYNIPIEILLGDGTEFMYYNKLLLNQFKWCGVLLLICSFFWRKACRNIIVNGG